MRKNKRHYTKQEMISKLQVARLNLTEADLVAGILERYPFGILEDVALTVKIISKGK